MPITLLDIPTLIVVFIASNLLVGCLMFAAFYGRKDRSVTLWIISLFCQAAGWVLLGACGGATPLWGMVLLSTSFSLIFHSFALHYGVKFRYYWPYWPVCVALMLAVASPDSMLVRQAISNALASLQVLIMSVLVISQRNQPTLLRLILALSGLLGATVLALRLASLLHSGQAQCLVEPSPVQSLMFVLLFLFRFSYMVGFILLIEGRHREAVTHLARLDSLTGIYNRRTFVELAERELLSSLRHQRSLSLLLFDLDYFKQVNDAHGHLAGDRVLGRVKTLVESCLRSGDVFARYGGEEFVVLAPETTAAGAASLAERLRQAIESGVGEDGLRVTASIGVVSVEVVTEACTLDHLLARADEAMYQAKAAGRNQVVVLAAGATVC